MKILKFGGTSLADEGTFQSVKNIIESNNSIVGVVVSASGNTTDQLQEIASKAEKGDERYKEMIDNLQNMHETLCSDLSVQYQSKEIVNVFIQLRRVCEGIFLLKELTKKSLDFILGSGELISSLIMTSFLQKKGINAKRFDSRELIVTDNNFGDACVDFDITNERINQSKTAFVDVNVFPGFIAATESGEITTLGRGGSDFTASIIAAALDADILEIWTDVDGIMTADPRRVRRSRTLDQVSYDEVLELSYFGAKVIHTQSIAPVFKKGIQVNVKNTFNPGKTGTLISDKPLDNQLIKGISSIDDVVIMSLSGGRSKHKIDFFPRVFKSLSDNQIVPVFITHSNAAQTITLGFKFDDAENAYEKLKTALNNDQENEMVSSEIVEKGYSLLALIGSNMKDQIGVSGTMFNVLGKNGISIKAISQGSSERNISAIIPQSDLNKALNVLHESFFLSQMKRVNLFIIGTGNVGKAFLNQLTKQFSFLKEQHHLNIKVIGVANSRKMAFKKDGIPLSKWDKHLQEGNPFEKDAFVQEMIAFNYRSSIFIDITASSEIAGLYTHILRQSISVVSPNKIAATESYEEYFNLKHTARKFKSQFLIETNVCAGLPILSTLNDLVRSGDRIIKLEAVLSGTLNFLFNEYDGSGSFVEVIREAKELGYTEPDPRLDISGEDVRRKLLILIRESGYTMEMEEIVMDSFLPESCGGSIDLEDFYDKVGKEESYFKALYKQATANRARLKIVASYEDGKGSVSLQEVPGSHPFYNLEGKDNIVLLYTDRYKEQPLVIKGAGAGAEVTASGIFADVLRISQSDA
ncbi:MAG: bifunctional aspartate kinase/homoserine dehydrogenase I [Ekhidna sp.]|nr:bifunctional aspartate kinase/homoserine dehydrogenase I [Ekhidna sp.]MBC6409844.1 bifunctional aspartate kinase/homoserine dehydrogenase I [Ekhidna sp.]